MIGSVSASLFITVIMGMIYRTWEVNGKQKPWIAIILGMAFSLLYMIYSGTQFVANEVINNIVDGLMIGLTAVGINEIGVKKVLSAKKSEQ